jgi:hypothetical protein
MKGSGDKEVAGSQLTEPTPSPKPHIGSYLPKAVSGPEGQDSELPEAILGPEGQDATGPSS